VDHLNTELLQYSNGHCNGCYFDGVRFGMLELPLMLFAKKKRNDSDVKLKKLKEFDKFRFGAAYFNTTTCITLSGDKFVFRTRC
jgi:hypothetical protein